MNEEAHEKHVAELVRIRKSAIYRLEKAKDGSLQKKRLLQDMEHLDNELRRSIYALEHPEHFRDVSATQRRAKRHQASSDIQKGFGCLTIGLVLTGAGYLLADPGDKYMVFWGIVAFGAFLLIRGVGGTRGWWG